MMENDHRMMNPKDAAAALAQVELAQERLAARAHWPLYRHALFGLVEGLVVAAVAQPIAHAGVLFVVAMGLLVLCVQGDRRRDGMFVSGWQRGATLPLTILIVLFALAMAWASASLRDGSAMVPMGYLLGVITFAVCTAASLRWEKVYRANLSETGQQ